jgi:hypothetical protein
MDKTTHMRIDTSRLAVNDLKAVVEWVESLGLVSADLSAVFALIQGKQGWELHVTEHLRNEDGHKYVDQARNDIVSRPVVVQLGPEVSWPEGIAWGRIL